MSGWGSPRRDLLVVAVCGVSLGALSAVRLQEHGIEAIPWVAGYAMATVVLFGPVSWWLRNRLSEPQRETLGYVGVGAAFLVGVVLFGFLYAFQWWFLAPLVVFDAMALGVVLGLPLLFLVEWFAVPAELRSPELRRFSE